MPRDALQVFYDADCRFCTAGAQRWGPLCSRHGFLMTPLQSPAARQRLHLAEGEVPEEMKVETRSGTLLGGVDAILYISRHIPFAWPLWLLGQVPFIHTLLVSRYRKFAATRNCRHGACRLNLTPQS
jgi:predicted DCC family thiol-disulfide oxidoreductase YuxK